MNKNRNIYKNTSENNCISVKTDDSLAIITDSGTTITLDGDGDEKTSCYIIVSEDALDTAKDIFSHVEEMPQFPGGDAELYKFIQQNLLYPDIEADVQGRVICRFVVNEDGSISNIEIQRSLEPTFDKEAVRVIKSMPKWIPGKHKGANVRVYYLLPITFKLSS